MRRARPAKSTQSGALALAAALACAAAIARSEVNALDAESTCVTCHEQEEDEAMSLPVPEWRESVHASHFVSCDGCHGGDPFEEDGDLSMSEEAGFLENPSWRELAGYCGACHEAIGESWSLGPLGERAREGTRVASCATCHMADGHRIVEAVPADLEIAERCPRCAPLAEADRMREAATRLAALEARALAAARAAQAKGVNAMALFREIEAAHEGFATTLHRFDPGLVDPQARGARAALEGVEARAREDARRADARRLYGAFVLLALGLLLVSLIWIRRRLP